VEWAPRRVVGLYLTVTEKWRAVHWWVCRRPDAYRRESICCLLECLQSLTQLVAASPRVQPCSKRLKHEQKNSIYLQIRHRPRRVWRSVSLSLTLAAAANNKTPDRATAAMQLLPSSRLQPTYDDTKWTFWDSLQQRWLAHTDAHAHTHTHGSLRTTYCSHCLMHGHCVIMLQVPTALLILLHFSHHRIQIMSPSNKNTQMSQLLHDTKQIFSKLSFDSELNLTLITELLYCEHSDKILRILCESDWCTTEFMIIIIKNNIK